MPRRYFHHTVGKYRAKNNAYGGHYDDKLERSGSGSDRRPEKIDRVVAYSHDEVQHGQCPHQHHQKEKDVVHYASVWFTVLNNGFSFKYFLRVCFQNVKPASSSLPASSFQK